MPNAPSIIAVPVPVQWVELGLIKPNNHLELPTRVIVNLNYYKHAVAVRSSALNKECAQLSGADGTAILVYQSIAEIQNQLGGTCGRLGKTSTSVAHADPTPNAPPQGQNNDGLIVP